MENPKKYRVVLILSSTTSKDKKMKEKILYTCEICHTDYTDKKTAKVTKLSIKDK